MTLKRYKQKRDFAKTPEPKGKVKISRGNLSFVIQRHHARRLHYDFRLEWRGTLKSWAVPKGPSLDPKDKRLAVEVEDHPLDYAGFEGEIPMGEYGAGKVFVWDNGTWDSENDIDQALRKGHLDFELHGKKLQGKWTLVRLRSGQSGKTNWLLMKRQDEFARAKSNIVEERPESVKKASPPPDFVEPQLAQLMDKAPQGPDWLHEIKFDGYRTICRIEGDDVRLLTRSGRDWTEKYGPLAEEVKLLPTTNALLDGEIAWTSDSSHHTDFQGLQTALMKKDFSRLVYYVFDILHLDGRDLRALPLSERKQILEKLLQGAPTPHLFYSKHWTGSGPEVYAQSCRLGLEGIVSKQADEAYVSGRSYGWQKITCSARQEFVIGGYTESTKNRPFGALLLGVYEGKELRYVGRAGTGFTDEALHQIAKKLQPLQQTTAPFVNPPRERDSRWVKPRLVAEVEYKTWTGGGLLRMASFQGLREDKDPKEIRKEIPLHGKRRKDDESEVQGVKISHPDRMLFPKAKKRKIDVVRFYDAAMERMMPFLKDRPLSLLRCQETSGKNCFFQKHAVGKGMHAKPVHYKEKSDTALSVNTPQDFIFLIQNGALEIHGWGARFAKITTPDMLVFDLDPESLELWPLVVETAHEIRGMLLQLGLEPFVKVTGGKGIHIQVPIEPHYDWDAIKDFSRSLMEVLVRRDPNRYTTNMSKKARKGKIFLDYLRNGYGATAVLPYSVRARERPTVALPIDWKELKDSLSPAAFEIDAAIKRLKRKDPWKDFWNKARPLAVLETQRAA